MKHQFSAQSFEMVEYIILTVTNFIFLLLKHFILQFKFATFNLDFKSSVFIVATSWFDIEQQCPLVATFFSEAENVFIPCFNPTVDSNLSCFLVKLSQIIIIFSKLSILRNTYQNICNHEFNYFQGFNRFFYVQFKSLDYF